MLLMNQYFQILVNIFFENWSYEDGIKRIKICTELYGV